MTTMLDRGVMPSAVIRLTSIAMIAKGSGVRCLRHGALAPRGVAAAASGVASVAAPSRRWVAASLGPPPDSTAMFRPSARGLIQSRLAGGESSR